MRNLLLYPSLVLLLLGCSKEWPPHFDELSEHHAKNLAAFNTLNQKLRASEYVFVGTDGFRNLPMPVDFQSISATKAFGSPREAIEDDREWSDLFEQTQLATVRLDSGTFEGDLHNNPVVGEQSYTAIYVHGEDTTRHNCQAHHINIPCGKCYAPLTDKWGIEYLWTNHAIVTAISRRAEAGDLPWRDVDAAVEEAVHRCRTEGYAEIGYTYAP